MTIRTRRRQVTRDGLKDRMLEAYYSCQMAWECEILQTSVNTTIKRHIVNSPECNETSLPTAFYSLKYDIKISLNSVN